MYCVHVLRGSAVKLYGLPPLGLLQTHVGQPSFACLLTVRVGRRYVKRYVRAFAACKRVSLPVFDRFVAVYDSKLYGCPGTSRVYGR